VSSGKVVETIAAFKPSTPLSASERGDTGRGPLPKDGCGESRFVNLKSPGKGKGTHTAPAQKRMGRPKLTLAQKGS
jgi:hypothetical protein